jgi:hypothetical protein
VASGGISSLTDLAVEFLSGPVPKRSALQRLKR